MKIGVFGGTFNPIHIAHMRMAEEYVWRLGLEKLILVPTYVPPHKEARNLADGEDRLAMCHLACAGNPVFEVSDFEVRQGGKSFTHKTLRHIQECYPDSELYLIMGADMFLTVQDWRLSREIFRMATLCAAEREQGELTLMAAHRKYLESQGARCIVIDMEPTPLSSTIIRESIRDCKDVTGLLHPDVWRYIWDQKLYQKG